MDVREQSASAEGVACLRACVLLESFMNPGRSCAVVTIAGCFKMRPDEEPTTCYAVHEVTVKNPRIRKPFNARSEDGKAQLARLQSELKGEHGTVILKVFTSSLPLTSHHGNRPFRFLWDLPLPGGKVARTVSTRFTVAKRQTRRDGKASPDFDRLPDPVPAGEDREEYLLRACTVDLLMPYSDLPVPPGGSFPPLEGAFAGAGTGILPGAGLPRNTTGESVGVEFPCPVGVQAAPAGAAVGGRRRARGLSPDSLRTDLHQPRSVRARRGESFPADVGTSTSEDSDEDGQGGERVGLGLGTGAQPLQALASAPPALSPAPAVVGAAMPAGHTAWLERHDSLGRHDSQGLFGGRQLSDDIFH